MTRNPMQPILSVQGRARFKPNAIVELILENCKLDLNDLAAMGDRFSQDDWEQFAQLIGYSVCGFHELSYVSDETALEAPRRARETGIVPADFDPGCRGAGCTVHSGVPRED